MKVFFILFHLLWYFEKWFNKTKKLIGELSMDAGIE